MSQLHYCFVDDDRKAIVCLCIRGVDHTEDEFDVPAEDPGGDRRMSDGPVFVERIDYGAALAERMRQIMAGENLSVSAIVSAALVGAQEARVEKRQLIYKRYVTDWRTEEVTGE